VRYVRQFGLGLLLFFGVHVYKMPRQRRFEKGICAICGNRITACAMKRSRNWIPTLSGRLRFPARIELAIETHSQPCGAYGIYLSAVEGSQPDFRYIRIVTSQPQERPVQAIVLGRQLAALMKGGELSSYLLRDRAPMPQFVVALVQDCEVSAWNIRSSNGKSMATGFSIG
jgi:hypothetical protein